jgi:hypothetical protein
MMDHSVRPWKKHGLWAQVQSVLPERVCLQMDCAALGKERIQRKIAAYAVNNLVMRQTIFRLAWQAADGS